MVSQRTNPITDAEHWAMSVENIIGSFWAKELEAATRDFTFGPEHCKKIAEHMVNLSEIVADLARMQASNFRAIKAANDAIGG